MPTYEPKPMTAMKVTRGFLEFCDLEASKSVADDDPVFSGIVVFMDDECFSVAPNELEFYEIFRLTDEPFTPEKFVPIERHP